MRILGGGVVVKEIDYCSEGFGFKTDPLTIALLKRIKHPKGKERYGQALYQLELTLLFFIFYFLFHLLIQEHRAEIPGYRA